FYPSCAVGLHPLRKPCLQRLEGFVQRHIVLVAFPDGAALIQCPDKRRTLSIIPDFNPAVGLHPACDIGIHLLKTACSLWHFLLTPLLTYLYDRHACPISRTRILCISSTVISTCSTTLPYSIPVGTFLPSRSCCRSYRHWRTMRSRWVS